MRTRAQINDRLRRGIGAAIGVLGGVCAITHRLRIASFARAQQQLRIRYGIDPTAPVLTYGPEIEQSIYRSSSLSRRSRWAETSGSTAAPKRILYTPSRIRSTAWTFIDAFARAYRACGGGRSSQLYVFRPLDEDRSLTSLLVELQDAASYLALLQAPYRAERHPAVRALADRYGATAVRLWILATANPGVLYSTNPSTLWLFLNEVTTDWHRSRQLIVDLRNRPQSFHQEIQRIARRLQSPGSADRLEQIATSDTALPLSVTSPAVHMVICWTGGYVKPFLDRLAAHLPQDRYQLVPMYAMSTETIETIGHYGKDGAAFLPLAPGVLYEFIEEELADSPENLKTIQELEPAKTYTMIVSDGYGLRRYQTEDVFLCERRVDGLPDLRFLRRRNVEYSFTGEKLSSAQLDRVFERMRSEGKAPQQAAFLACIPSSPGGTLLPHYKLALIGASGSASQTEDHRSAWECDRLIQEANPEYRQKRESGRLGTVEAQRISAREFAARIGRSAPGTHPGSLDGQFKFLPLYRRLWEELPG